MCMHSCLRLAVELGGRCSERLKRLRSSCLHCRCTRSLAAGGCGLHSQCSLHLVRLGHPLRSAALAPFYSAVSWAGAVTGLSAAEPHGQAGLHFQHIAAKAGVACSELCGAQRSRREASEDGSKRARCAAARLSQQPTIQRGTLAWRSCVWGDAGCS